MIRLDVFSNVESVQWSTEQESCRRCQEFGVVVCLNAVCFLSKLAYRKMSMYMYIHVSTSVCLCVCPTHRHLRARSLKSLADLELLHGHLSAAMKHYREAHTVFKHIKVS